MRSLAAIVRDRLGGEGAPRRPETAMEVVSGAKVRPEASPSDKPARGAPAGEALAPIPGGSAEGGTSAGSRTSLQSLQREVADCKRCPLHKTRRNAVFGSGKGSTRILFVGEAPGRDEDLQGLPFVGRAGQLLTRIIEAIKFKREDVYIANVLKCRPPDNRNPLPEEVARCRPYLMKQIELLRPKVICTLGVFATQSLLGTKSPLTVLRGQVHEVDGLTVVPTYHPAACLRYPRLKEAVWEDVKLLREEYLS